MKVEVMAHHVRVFDAIPSGWMLSYLEELSKELPEKYGFANRQQMRNMAARMEIAKRALQRGTATIVSDQVPDIACQACPDELKCFSKPL